MSKRSYRKQIVHTWNEIAPRYQRVKAGGPGPFESTGKMLSMHIKISCGTGAVLSSCYSVHGGLVVGVDAFSGANFHPVIYADMRFSGKPFDAATCRRRTKRSLKSRGVLAMAVHGRDTPFYSSILKAVGQNTRKFQVPCILEYTCLENFTHRRFTHSGSNIPCNAQIYKKTSYSLGIFCRYNNNLPGKFYHTLVRI